MRVPALLVAVATTFLAPASLLAELVTVHVAIDSSSEPFVFDPEEDLTAVAERFAEHHGLDSGAGCEGEYSKERGNPSACVVSQTRDARLTARCISRLWI